MTLHERVLYHQTHPLKVATDISAGFVALYFFKEHLLPPDVVVVPPVAVSVLLSWRANLDRDRTSALGRYVRHYMTRFREALRPAGFVIMSVGAWAHLWRFIGFGLLIIILCWLPGIPWPRRGVKIYIW